MYIIYTCTVYNHMQCINIYIQNVEFVMYMYIQTMDLYILYACILYICISAYLLFLPCHSILTVHIYEHLHICTMDSARHKLKYPCVVLAYSVFRFSSKASSTISGDVVLNWRPSTPSTERKVQLISAKKSLMTHCAQIFQ